jgi:broad-specificity NMP kinase
MDALVLREELEKRGWDADKIDSHLVYDVMDIVETHLYNDNPHFPFTAEGYSAAKAWLKEIGEWERVSTSGFSTDGWSITETANILWKKRNNK